MSCCLSFRSLLGNKIIEDCVMTLFIRKFVTDTDNITPKRSFYCSQLPKVFFLIQQHLSEFSEFGGADHNNLDIPWYFNQSVFVDGNENADRCGNLLYVMRVRFNLLKYFWSLRLILNTYTHVSASKVCSEYSKVINYIHTFF